MKRYKRYFKYIRPNLPYLIVGVLMGIPYGILSGFGLPFIMQKVLIKVFPDQGATEVYSMWGIVGIAMLLPGVFALRAITGYVSSLLMTRASLDILRRIKQGVFSKIQDYPIAFFDKFTTGDLMIRLNSDTSAVQSVMVTLSTETFLQPLIVFGSLSYLAYLSAMHGQVIFLLVFVIAVPFFIIPIQMMRRKLKNYSRMSQVELSKVAQLFNENLDAAHEIRVFNLQDPQKCRFEDMNYAYQRFSLKVAKYQLINQPLMEFLAAVMIAVCFVYVYRANIDFTVFMSMGAALYFIIDPIKRIVRMASDLIKTGPLFDRIEEVLDYVSTVPEPENPVEINTLQGEIAFHDVSFSYKDKVVLKNANITIPAGTSCALVGESGAGKSTFAKLAMRLYDPISGFVSVDGISIHDMRSIDYAANIGSVPQYPVLFNDTVYNNILLARPDATEDEVYAAAKNAYAHDFIETLENGYETIVGERGDKLSGGQKQRIAIARVFLKNPPIIVLDEATSALDANSESFIQLALEKLMSERTVLIIAHRFSTIKNVQKIIVFRDGSIIDFGSHIELMARCEYYRHLYERQMSSVE